MGILNILLAGIIALSGLPAGILLGKATKEELKAGKKYFEWLQGSILIIASMIFFQSYGVNTRLFIAISLLIIMLVIKFNPRAAVTYLIFLFYFIASAGNEQLLFRISSLVFLYGLPTGSLIRHIGLKKYMQEEIENPADERRNIIQKIIYIAWVIMLEILAIPTVFMKKKPCAEFHLNFICPICPSSRRRHRDVNGESTCWWENNWRKGNYSIPKHFGIINWIKQYMTGSTNLKKFKTNDKDEKI